MNRFYFRFFLPACFILFLSVINSPLYAATYYVSSTQGDDNRSLVDAKNLATPWKTLAKVNAIMGSLQAGDQVLFKRGDVFSGTLTVTVSGSVGNPIVFGAYGDGALPELSGFVQLSNWQQKGNGVWETTVPAGLSYINTVIMNGAAKAVGRYPNASAVNQGYLYYQSYNGNSSITDSKLSTQNWTGGQVVIRKTRWIIDRNPISSQSGNTINYSSQSGYGAAQGYGYFIQNHPSTLDTLGEWYYQPDGQKLGVFTGGTNPGNYQIKAGVVETLVQLSNQNNVTFDSLNFTGATASALSVNASQSIRLSNCRVLFSGKNAIEVNNSNGLTVENTIISHTGNNALSLNNCTNAVLRNNQIKNTGTFAGMGEGGDGTYEAITISGDNNLVANNTIDSTGYVPLNFSGNNVTIKNNVITNFTLTKDDGGGIYTWNNGSNAPTNSNRVITGNTVLNGVGAPGGTDGPNKRFAHGIYIDDNAAQVEISSNTVANCATYGVYIHNAHDIAIKQNTLYNNATQLYMEHDNVAADKPIYNCTVTGNVLFAKLATQLSAEYKTKDNDIANFGTFDQNSYYRPQDNDLSIGVLQQVNGTYSYNQLSVESWKALYGKDANSTKSLHTVPTYVVNKVLAANQFGNGNFDSNVGGLYAYASANNIQTSWDNGTLDGGALKITFSSTSTNSNYGSVIIGIGAVTGGKQYRLKFSMIGGNTYKAITTYLRQSTGNYADLSARKAATILNTRAEKEFLFTATATESNASIVFDVPEQTSPVFLDNIKLEQVEAMAANPDQYISFLDNTTSSTQSYATGTQSYDAAGNSYSGSVKLNPFSSLILVTDVAATTAANNAPVTTATCSATGTILREQWDNISGTSISNIPLQTKPTSTSQLTAFEGPLNVADNYGSRIRGYICPPQTGTYTFWLATDDAGELWLSTDSTVVNKVRIANVDGWTNFREWGKYPSQKSAQITLQAGQKYYIEALQKEGGGGDNLSVQWQLPDATMETPIAGSHLSPYVDTTKTITAVGTGTMLREEWDNVGGTGIADIPLQAKPTSSAQINAFEGPLNVADNYGSRIRGYICPSQTGTYTFWLATDDAGELWLSTDQNPANKVRIANIDGWTNFREWGKYPSQKSAQITLQAGQKYYVEALQKEGGGGDNLSVQWQQPDGSMETPIAGNHIAPYVPTTTDQTINFAALANKTVGDAPFTLTASASSGLPVSFSVVSGPATISGNTVSITGAGTVTIAAAQAGNASFNAAKTVSQSFTVIAATCQATGTILREEWSNVPGNNISDFPQQTMPTSTSQLTAFEGPTNIGDNYASRIRGYICAPADGNYTFWIAGDDAAELYISTDDNPSNKVRIANLLSWTNSREWNKFPSQQLAAITLQAGKKYYIEAIHKEGGGGDNLAVQWQLPNGTVESPLPGKYLSPFVADQLSTSALASSFNSVASPAAISITEPLSAAKAGLFVYPNPVSQQSSVSFMLKESGQTDVVLYDAKGQFIRKVFTGVTAANAETSVSLDAQSLKSGMYMLRLISGKNMLTKKIIVMK